jgi:hypothetical protein
VIRIANKIESELLKGDWTDEERRVADQTLMKLPPQLTTGNPNLKDVERKKKLEPKPPGAPGDSEFKGGRVVVYDKGVYNGGRLDKDNLRRSILHELAHSVDDEVPHVFAQWCAISWWRKVHGEWRHGPHAKFVDDYAGTSPYEDWADTFSEYHLHPEIVRKRFPEKFRFIERFLGAVSRGEIKLKKKKET